MVRGEEVRLSPREYDILRLLVAHAGKVLTHKFILREVWGGETDVQYLRVYIRALRQKTRSRSRAAAAYPDRDGRRLSAARAGLGRGAKRRLSLSFASFPRKRESQGRKRLGVVARLISPMQKSRH